MPSVIYLPYNEAVFGEVNLMGQSISSSSFNVAATLVLYKSCHTFGTRLVLYPAFWISCPYSMGKARSRPPSLQAADANQCQIYGNDVL